MKKLLVFFTLILLCGCSGYSPIFSSKQINFYIEQVIVKDDNQLIRKIVKNLKPYTINNNTKKIKLELDLKLDETVILRDEKGDVATQEIRITLNVKSYFSNDEIKKFKFMEKFTVNNQSNKFELNQYKKNIQSTMVDKIYEDLIIKLRTLQIMIIKNYQLETNNISKHNFFLFYGDNEGFKNEKINFILETTNYKKYSYNEKEVLNNIENFSNSLLTKSFFDNEKIIIIKNATDKVLNLLKDIIKRKREEIRRTSY